MCAMFPVGGHAGPRYSQRHLWSESGRAAAGQHHHLSADGHQQGGVSERNERVRAGPPGLRPQVLRPPPPSRSSTLTAAKAPAPTVPTSATVTIRLNSTRTSTTPATTTTTITTMRTSASRALHLLANVFYHYNRASLLLSLVFLFCYLKRCFVFHLHLDFDLSSKVCKT